MVDNGENGAFGCGNSLEIRHILHWDCVQHLLKHLFIGSPCKLGPTAQKAEENLLHACRCKCQGKCRIIISGHLPGKNMKRALFLGKREDTRAMRLLTLWTVIFYYSISYVQSFLIKYQKPLDKFLWKFLGTRVDFRAESWFPLNQFYRFYIFNNCSFPFHIFKNIKH